MIVGTKFKDNKNISYDFKLLDIKTFLGYPFDKRIIDMINQCPIIIFKKKKISNQPFQLNKSLFFIFWIIDLNWIELAADFSKSTFIGLVPLLTIKITNPMCVLYI